MINKALALIAYCLRWLVWAFHYLVIWPAATVMLIFTLIFWLDNSTPGQVAADEIAASTRYVNHGEFRIPGGCGPSLGGPLYGDRCHSTDAEGYADYIKESIDEPWRGTWKALWVVMALVYAGLAWLLGYFPRYVFVKVADEVGGIALQGGEQSQRWRASSRRTGWRGRKTQPGKRSAKKRMFSGNDSGRIDEE